MQGNTTTSTHHKLAMLLKDSVPRCLLTLYNTKYLEVLLLRRANLKKMSALRQGGRRQTAAYISPQELAAREVYTRKSAQTDNVVLPVGYEKKRANNARAIPTESISMESIPPIPTSNTILQYNSAIFPVHERSPWERYRPIVTSLDLGGKVTIARVLKASTIVGLKQFSASKPKEIIDRFHKLRHTNLVNGLEAFNKMSQLFIVLEEMNVSLTSIVKSPVDLGSQQVAAIMGQVSLLL